MSMTVEEKIEELERRVLELEKIAQTEEVIVHDSISLREKVLVDQYGEHVDKSTAAKILGVTRVTVYKMIEDGRINAVYGGKRVDVRSIARFISSPGRRKR